MIDFDYHKSCFITENGLDSTKLRPSKPPKKSVRFTLGAPESSDDETSVSSDTCGKFI